jgi:hypothetical protein
MKIESHGGDNAVGCMSAIAFCLVGLFVFIFFPIVGWVLGPVIVVVGIIISNQKAKKSSVWRCVDCGAIVSRI